MQEEQIQNLLTDLSGKLKRSRGEIRPKEFGSNYQRALDVMQQISVHCKDRVWPEQLMKAKAPNETEQELNYRKNIFEPITKPYWDRALNALNRIWAEQNYSISWKDAELQNYFTADYPIYRSIVTYFKTIVTHYKINDPNAVFICDIGKLPLISDDEGNLQIDQSKELEPLCKIYPSDKVIYFDMNEYCLVLGSDKSAVGTGSDNKAEMAGLVFYLFTDNEIYRIPQKGRKTDYSFDMQLLYAHNLGYLPCRRLVASN